MTDANEIKSVVTVFEEKSNNVQNTILAITDTIDEMEAMAISLGIDAPPVVNLLRLALDNLGSTNHQVGQATEILKHWSRKL